MEFAKKIAQIRSRVLERKSLPATYRRFNFKNVLQIIQSELNDIIYFVETHEGKLMSGQVVYVNEKVKAVTGYEPEDFLENPLLWESLLHPEDRSAVMAATKQMLTRKKPVTRVYRILNRDKAEYRWVEDYIIPQFNAVGTFIGLVGIARDITDRKNFEELFFNISEGISALTGSDFFNSLVKFLARTLKTYIVFVVELLDSKQSRVKTVAACIEQKLVEDFEYQLENTPCEYATKTGFVAYIKGVQNYFPNDAFLAGHQIESYLGIALKNSRGKTIGVLVLMDKKPFEDFHKMENLVRIFAARAAAELERIKAEEESSFSERRLRAVFEHAKDSIALFDDTGKLIEANQAMAHLTGCDLQELYEKTVFDLISPGEAAVSKHMWRSFKNTGESQGEVMLIKKGGEVINVEYKAIANVIKGMHMVIMNDVTERKELEKAILEALEKERSTIVRDIHDGLGQFLSGAEMIAKALVNNLSKQGLPEAADSQKILDLIKRANAETNQIIKGLSPVSLEDKTFRELIQELCEHIRSTFNISCLFDFDKDLAFKDRNTVIQLYRIIQEAVHNAIKHGKAKNVFIELKTKRENIILTIADDGKGMPDDFEEKTGTGLKSMKYRAKILNGTVHFLKNPTGGTRVTCIFARKKLIL